MKNFIKMLSMMNSQRYSRTINELLSKKIPCGFFCAFDASQGKINNAVALKQSGLNLQCICVLNETARSNLRTEGIPVLTFHEFAALQSKPQWMLYIDTSMDVAFCDFFRRLDLNTLKLDNTSEADRQYDELYQHLDEIAEVYQMLDDEESRTVYRAFIKARISNRSDYYRYASEPQYFLETFLPSAGDIAIDGGAYDDATAIDFASLGATVYAFEMDQRNYQRALPRLEKYNFTLENMGLSSEERTASYIPGGAGSRMIFINAIGI